MPPVDAVAAAGVEAAVRVNSSWAPVRIRNQTPAVPEALECGGEKASSAQNCTVGSSIELYRWLRQRPSEIPRAAGPERGPESLRPRSVSSHSP
jgi:hypothetical protein